MDDCPEKIACFDMYAWKMDVNFHQGVYEIADKSGLPNKHANAKASYALLVSTYEGIGLFKNLDELSDYNIILALYVILLSKFCIMLLFYFP